MVVLTDYDIDSHQDFLIDIINENVNGIQGEKIFDDMTERFISTFGEQKNQNEF